MKAGTRRAHTKSRNGCSYCRKARVKCNEEVPRCARCISRNLECDFEDNSTLSRTLRPSWIRQSIIIPSISPLPLTIEQRSLIHHFANSTCDPMITYNTHNSFWRMDMPRVALHCDYLLSAILALSTIHKVHLSSSTDLSPDANLKLDINHSLRLHKTSISQFTASVSTITRENIIPAIALASLSAVYSCALAQLLPAFTATDHVDQAITVVVSLYKALRVFRGHKPWIQNTGIEIGDHDGPDVVERKGKKNLADFMVKARKLRVINDRYCDNDSEKAIYDTAITAFLDIHAHWTMKIPPSYVELLQQKKPMALLILNVFALEDIEAEEQQAPWFMRIWREGLRDFMRDFLGPLWNEYCDLQTQDDLPAFNARIETIPSK